MTASTQTRAPDTAEAEAAAWLRRYRPDDSAAVRLFCFPHAGGSATAYLPLARRFGPSVEVVAVQYPGRQDRRHEPFLESVEELVDAVVPVLREWTGRPYALFGHSMGATLAYETARKLVAEGGEPPAHLFVSGRRSPTVPRRDTVHLLDDAGLLAEVARLQGTDAGLLQDEELLRMVLPPLRNDYRVAGRYRHLAGPPLTVPLTVITGDSDPNVPVGDAHAWQAVAHGPTALHVLPGGHFYLNDQQDAVCRIVEEALGHAR